MTSWAVVRKAVKRARYRVFRMRNFMGGEFSREGSIMPPAELIKPASRGLKLDSGRRFMSWLLVDGAGFALQEIHEQILAEVIGSGEVGFAFAHLGDLLDELDEAVVGGEHESVDHDAGALALVDLFHGLAHYKGVEAKGVFVDATIFEGQRGGFAVGDHDDLAHVFALAEEDALRHAQSFAGIGVIRTNLHTGELAEGDFFGRVVEQDQA